MLTARGATGKDGEAPWRRLAPLFLMAFVAAGAAALGAALKSPARQAIEISLSPTAGGAFRLDYALSSPVRALDLGPSLNGFRMRDWRIETPGLRLAAANGRDRLEAIREGARLSKASILVSPRQNGFQKNYEPIRRVAGGGYVLYTGDFWPYTEEGARYKARFDIEARAGERVVAFGQSARAFKNWRSPTGLPSFIYIGPLAPVEEGGLHAIIDPKTPDWARRELLALAPRLIDYYEKAFGRKLARPPDFFLVMNEDAAPDHLAYDGDALPGQVEIALKGEDWRASSDEGRALLQDAAAHEIAHLFEAAASPASPAAPDWIHEGGADALGAEALLRLGVISGADALARLDKARATCADALDFGSLDAAEAKGDWAASYACGRVLTVIAARAWSTSGSVAEFWRDFIARASHEGGYSAALFFDMIGTRAGPEFALEARAFPHTVYAEPAAVLESLLDRARPLEGTGGG